MPTSSTARTKVVLRKLPPSYDSEEFIKYVSPVEEHNYYYFVPGCKSGDLFSRAYFNFLNEEDTNLFKERYDGYVFLDQKGEEFTAQVEYAPYQKIPSRVKVDPLSGTIEADSEFLRFVEMLKKAEEALKQPESLIESLEASKAKMEAEHDKTPLLDFMKNKEDRKQIRDDKRPRRSERSDRSARPPKSKPSRGSRKERLKEKMSERKSKSEGKSKSAAESSVKLLKSSETSKTDKAQETKGSGGDSKDIHVETIINNTKVSSEKKKEADAPNFNDESKYYEKQEKGRAKHSYEKQRKTLKQRNETAEESLKPQKSYEKASLNKDKAIKILRNPAKEGLEKDRRSVKEGIKTEVTTVKTDIKEVKVNGNNDVKHGKEELRKDKVGVNLEGKQGGSEVKGGGDASDESKQPRKPRVRNKDRPERPIYKPGPRRKE